MRFREELLGDEVKQRRASESEDSGQHGAAGVSEECCSADRSYDDGERRADRHENGLAFRGAALQEFVGEGKSEERTSKG